MSADRVDPQASARSAEEQQQADAKRYAELVDDIAWLDASPNTSISDVITAQRSRLTQELRQIALAAQSSSSAATELREEAGGPMVPE